MNKRSVGIILLEIGLIAAGLVLKKFPLLIIGITILFWTLAVFLPTKRREGSQNVAAAKMGAIKPGDAVSIIAGAIKPGDAVCIKQDVKMNCGATLIAGEAGIVDSIISEVTALVAFDRFNRPVAVSIDNIQK